VQTAPIPDCLLFLELLIVVLNMEPRYGSLRGRLSNLNPFGGNALRGAAGRGSVKHVQERTSSANTHDEVLERARLFRQHPWRGAASARGCSAPGPGTL